MIRPGFHSAALLVHLSGLFVAIRRAWRHLKVSSVCRHPIYDVVCQHFLIQSSVFSAPFSTEILLSWSHSSCVCCRWVHSLRHLECLFLPGFLCFHFCDETKHSALCCTEHFASSFGVSAPYVIVGVTTASKMCKPVS